MTNYLINKTLFFLLFTYIGAAVTLLFDAYLEASMQFFAVFLVITLDQFFGSIKAYKNGTFETRKALKSVYKLVGYWAILAVVIAIESGYSYMEWLSEAIMVPLIIFTLVSVLKNMQILGLIQDNVLMQILSKIDKHKDELK